MVRADDSSRHSQADLQPELVVTWRCSIQSSDEVSQWLCRGDVLLSSIILLLSRTEICARLSSVETSDRLESLTPRAE